MKGQPKMDNR